MEGAADAGDSSGSDSLVNYVSAAKERSRHLLASRRQRRATLYADAIMDSAGGGLAPLERLAGTSQTQRRYAKYLEKF